MIELADIIHGKNEQLTVDSVVAAAVIGIQAYRSSKKEDME